MPNPSELPFFNEYLAQVLKPRVEQVIAEQTERLPDLVWEAIAKAIAEQEGAATPDDISTLMREQLGLRLDVEMHADFDAIEQDAPTRSRPAGSGVVEGDVIDHESDTVNVRRRASVSPLAAAVTSNRRKK